MLRILSLIPKLFRLFCILVTILSIASVLSFVNLNEWVETPYGEAGKEVEISLDKGSSLSLLSSKLFDSGVISSRVKFQIWVKLLSDFRKFQAGNYKFTLPLNVKEVNDTFIQGKTYSKALYEVVIPEGYTEKQIVEKFVQAGIGTRKNYWELLQDPEFLGPLGVEYLSAEGYLYPATYSFFTMPTEEEVIKKMITTFWERLPDQYEIHVASRGLSLREGIILASLIEAETANEEEKDDISDVIWNRLNKGMQLGIDAAIIYGIPNFDGDLKRKDLTNEENPYNLRIHKGLPPTPINTPSQKSLLAVLNPSMKGYLFYVLDPLKEKSHVFTKTIEEHNEAVKRYLKR